jgi:hypothetical protein
MIHQNGKEYVVTTDESGGGLDGGPAGMCAQRSYGRMIDISDERHPQVVGTFKTDVNKPENCAAIMAADTNGGMIHYLGIDDRFHARLVFYASANQGVRIVDWADPTKPKEIAYFHAPNDAKTAAGATDFTRPDIKYDPTNCMLYTGWNQGGEKTIEITNPDYNPCMKRAASGAAAMLDGSGKLKAQVAVTARRTAGKLVGSFMLTDAQTHENLRMSQLTMLGSVRDACGSVSSQSMTSMQFEGSGTYNGNAATFRVCVQQNGGGAHGAPADVLHVQCTTGCSYSADGPVVGNLPVTQQQ